MRLLRLDHGSRVTLVEIYGDIPAYAILSHTWGADGDEVSFKDVVKGRHEDKPGYHKIRFCMKQAASDGLQYIWVDTCCIDKSSSAELSEAINSMFRWYQNAAKCYVYLTDVSIEGWESSIEHDPSVEEIRTTILEQSRWFTRGWTLQELLAPPIVEFFSLEGERLGDKQTLVHQIHAVTRILMPALKGTPLSTFSVAERMSWAANRMTKREEDAAYSLFGLFDLHMPLLYGEGRKKAFVRLLRQVQSELDSDLPDGIEQQPPQPLPDGPTAGTHGQSVAVDTAMSNHSERYQKETSQIAQNLFAAETSPKPETVQNDHTIAEKHAVRERATEMQTWWHESVAINMRPDAYVKIAVLLIKWTDELDELQSRAEVEELQGVFGERFNFTTAIVELDGFTKPQYQLNRYLSAFVEQHDGPGNLLIVYYSGHGVFREDLMYLELTASLYPSRHDQKYYRANWAKAEEILRSDDIESDVLTILDTTYASNLMKSGQTSSTRETGKRFELLSACAIDSTTAAPGLHSFTRALIDALIELINEVGDHSFSTFFLNQRILLDKRRYDMPSQLWTLSGNNEHHIRLSRLKPNTHRTHALFRQNQVGGYIDLRLSMRDATLSREQVEYIAKNLVRALSKKAFIGVRKIDWLGFQPAAGSLFDRVALVIEVVTRWKRAVRRGRRGDSRKRGFGELEASAGSELPSD